MCYVAENHNYMCHIRAKGFFRFELIDEIFTKLPHISHIHKIVFLKYHWKRIDQLLLPYKFHGKTCKEPIFFFHFASCEPLNGSSRQNDIIFVKFLFHCSFPMVNSLLLNICFSRTFNLSSCLLFCQS